MVKCLICNSDFEKQSNLLHHLKPKHNISTKQYYDRYFKQDCEGFCKLCKEPTKFKNFKTGYQRYCSCKCAQNDSTVNNFIRNNPQKDQKIRLKTKETVKRKYGGFGLSSDIIKQKASKTLMNKFGVINPYQKQEIQEKAVKNSHTEVADIKRYQTFLYNVRTIGKEVNGIWVQDLLKITKSSGWYQCGVVDLVKYKNYVFVRLEDVEKVLYYDDNSYNTYSIKEKKLLEFIKSIYNDTIITNSKKIIPPKEIDIYLPRIKLAIEYNGIYFHSSSKILPEYHLNKSLMCKEKGIRLIHIYEFENFLTQSKLLRELIVNNIDNYPKDDFNKNNLSDNIPKPEIIYNDSYHIIYGAGPLQ